VVSRVPNWNLMRRVDRLDFAWIQGSPTLQASPPLTFDEGFDVVENPSRPNRTPLTEKEVEAIRTARAGGESVLSIAKRFGIHRATVWTHTRHSTK
jgi:DNA-binding NarL/FixJ family response regulator